MTDLQANTSATIRESVADRAAWLEAFLSQAKDDLARVAGEEGRWSWARLGVFIALVAVWFMFASQVWVALGLSVALLFVFVVCIRIHNRVRSAREFHVRLVEAAKDASARVGGTVLPLRGCLRPADDAEIDGVLPHVFDRGATWPLTEQEIGDLDLFVEDSGVFGLLNRTSTDLGARRLRDALVAPLFDAGRIRERQAAVQWLADHPAERLELLAAAARLRHEDRRLKKLINAVRECEPLKLIAPASALRAWGGLSAMLLLGSIVATLGPAATAAGAVISVVLLVNIVIYSMTHGQIGAALHAWRDVAWPVAGCREVATRAAGALPRDGELGEIQARFARVAEPNVLPMLERRVGWAEGGGLVALLLNMLCLYELQVAQSIVKRAAPNRDALLESFAALGELEVVISLSSFAWEQPVASVPELVDTTTVEITGGRHPLIPPERVIPNDITVGDPTRMWIITGSNMAGKSTLLRVTGVSVVLAQIGSLVTAESMRLSPLRLITDLRASDNLSRDESYFLAEVRHLRRMVHPPAGETPLLGLIDEPFRGTNSLDQSAASVAVVQHLLRGEHLFLVATHDRHITKLADGTGVRNIHFRENLGDAGGMVFDYRIHEGPATTRNALKILEIEGYPAALMDDAHAWLNEHEPHEAEEVDQRA